jgi:hypothetical protein
LVQSSLLAADRLELGRWLAARLIFTESVTRALLAVEHTQAAWQDHLLGKVTLARLEWAVTAAAVAVRRRQEVPVPEPPQARAVLGR